VFSEITNIQQYQQREQRKLKDKLFNSSYLSKDFQKYANKPLMILKFSHTQSIFQHISVVANTTTTITIDKF